MASLATFAAVQTLGTIKGLRGCSRSGIKKLHVKPSRQGFRPKTIRNGAVVANYGDKSVYFDLENLGNTTGQWDLYGFDAPSPYNSLQHEHMERLDDCLLLSKFFETFAAPFTKRGLLLKFLILGGGLTLAYFSSTAMGDILPIKEGTSAPAEVGATWQDLISILSGICLCMYHVEFLRFNIGAIANNKP